MIAAVLAGVVIGAAIGLLGGGGSILAVPALIYAVGMPVRQAVVTSLVVVGVSSAAAAAPRAWQRQVRWPVALVFGLAGAATAFAGTAVNRLLAGQVLLLAFAVLMAVVAVQMLRGSESEGGACAAPDGRINWRGCLPKALGTGAFVGFLTGLFGVGGGFVVVPALTLLLGLDMTVAIGTSLVVIVLNSVAGFVAHAGDTSPDWGITVAFTASALVTSLVAARAGTRLDSTRLRRAFAVLVLVVAAFVAVAAIVDPAAVGS